MDSEYVWISGKSLADKIDHRVCRMIIRLDLMQVNQILLLWILQ